MQIGNTYKTYEGGTVKILAYENAFRVQVKHQDDHGHETWVRAAQLRNGQVKNPYHPSVLGTGYLGSGHHEASKKGKLTPAYAAWLSMLQRCYSPKYHTKHPTYIGCTVADEWHSFQAFADWFEDQCREDDWHLDKDLLVEGNKVYGPETCMFVPQEVNKLFGDCGAVRGAYPLGVSRDGKGYQTHLSKRNKREYLGYFSTVRQAQAAYSKAKIDHVLELIENDFRYLPERIKNAIFIKVVS